MRRSPRSTLFPYTTLFRSDGQDSSIAKSARALREVSAATSATGRPTARATVCAMCGKKAGSLRRPLGWGLRSEEHTSELQSHSDLVCRLLLEKKKQTNSTG